MSHMHSGGARVRRGSKLNRYSLGERNELLAIVCRWWLGGGAQPPPGGPLHLWGPLVAPLPLYIYSILYIMRTDNNHNNEDKSSAVTVTYS